MGFFLECSSSRRRLLPRWFSEIPRKMGSILIKMLFGRNPLWSHTCLYPMILEQLSISCIGQTTPHSKFSTTLDRNPQTFFFISRSSILSSQRRGRLWCLLAKHGPRWRGPRRGLRQGPFRVGVFFTSLQRSWTRVDSNPCMSRERGIHWELIRVWGRSLLNTSSAF